MPRKPYIFLSLATACSLAGAQAWADTFGVHGTMHPLGFPTPNGPTLQMMTDLYNIIFIIIAVVALVVALPIGYVLWRFRQSKVKKAATFSHNGTLELLWTTIPAAICMFIMWVSYQAMIQLRTMPANGVNIEAVAYQFGWDFYYPDASENGTHVKAEAPTKPDAELSRPGAERLVPELVVPVGKPIIMHVTSADVLHAFFNPHLGVKIDAIPGRINYAWFEADKPGTYLGQCAELCGSAHSEMFFNVRAVSDAEYADYIKARRVDAGLPPVHIDSVISGTTVSGTTPSSDSTVISGTTPLATTALGKALGISGTVRSEPTSQAANSVAVPVSSTAKITATVPLKATGK